MHVEDYTIEGGWYDGEWYDHAEWSEVGDGDMSNFDAIVVNVELSNGDHEYYTIHGAEDEASLDELVDDLVDSYGE